jgi:hypothetical protein
VTYQFRYFVQNLENIDFLRTSTVILVYDWKEVGVYRDNIKTNRKQDDSTKPEVRTFLVKLDLEVPGLFSVQQSILYSPVYKQLTRTIIRGVLTRLRNPHYRSFSC